MRFIIESILFINGVLAFGFCLVFIVAVEKRYIGNHLLNFLNLASCIWSLGFALMETTKDVHVAHIYRSIGILGTFLYMIAAQNLLCYISGVKRIVSRILNLIATSGLILYVIELDPKYITYKYTDWGMTYSFVPGIVNTLYTVYFVMVSINIIGIEIYMIKSPLKRLQMFGKKFLLVEAIILIGTVFDMVYPFVGKNSIPGSVITQFFGIIVCWYAMDDLNRCRITDKNITSQVYSSLQTPLLVYDLSRSLQILNDSAVDFFGFNREDDLHNWSLSDLFEIKSPEEEDFTENVIEADAICKVNNVPVHLQINRIADKYGDPIGLMVLVNDMTYTVETRKKLENAKEEAEEANKAKSVFLANMSHEIRTPINAIMGFAELSLNENVSPEIREYLTDIKSASQTLLGSINDILNISKIESGKMEIVCEEYSLTVLLKNVRRIISVQAASKGLDFSVKINGKVPSILYGDDLRIQEILINLLNNSVKYTKKGSIRLEVSSKEAKDDLYEIKFSVIDTGMGIREEDQKTLFEAYERLDKEKNHRIEGTGLGLAIVYGYVQLMDGTIDVVSEYGKGSEFIVELSQKVINNNPVFEEEINKSDTVSSRLGSVKFKDTRVLIVDDNRVNLKVISRTLNAFGIEADLAASGAECLSICKETKYPIVFMDHMMPEMDGVEALHRLRFLNAFYEKEAKIVVLTANAIEGVEDELKGKGFDDYLSKPIDLNELERVLREFKKKKKIMSEE